MGIPVWIAGLGVLGTWFIFGAAIWGEKIRSSIFKPELRVTLDDPRGVPINQTITTVAHAPSELPAASSQVSLAQVQQYTRPARYYYLSVRNTRRWPVAYDVRVLLTRVETPDPGGVPTTIWTGEIPFRWEHAEIQPASRTLGRAARADFVVAAQDPRELRERQNQLHLMPVIEPNNLQRSYYTSTHIWVTVIATANEADSPALRLELAWDGQWNAGEAEMARHLVIRSA
jgi:hypothetical protein